MRHGLVIPTRGDHPELLAALITNSGLPNDLIVVTSNNPDYQHPHQTTLIYDHGPINIHRWWNLGLTILEHLGCTYATVLNDDTEIDTHTLRHMREALQVTGATLSHPGPPGATPGHAWTLNLQHGIRPDQNYSWWYGDNQLYEDAHHKGHGVTALPHLTIPHHHHNQTTSSNPQLQALAEQDKQRWDSRHSRA